MWASTVIPGEQHETNTTSKHIFVFMIDTDGTDHSSKADLSFNPHTWCHLSTLKHFQLISSKVKRFFFFIFYTQRSFLFIFWIQFKAAFHENCVTVLIKNILNYCRSSLNLKSTLCIHSNYLNCLLWGVIDMQRGEKNSYDLLKFLQYVDMWWVCLERHSEVKKGPSNCVPTIVM